MAFSPEEILEEFTQAAGLHREWFQGVVVRHLVDPNASQRCREWRARLAPPTGLKRPFFPAWRSNPKVKPPRRHTPRGAVTNGVLEHRRNYERNLEKNRRYARDRQRAKSARLRTFKLVLAQLLELALHGEGQHHAAREP